MPSVVIPITNVRVDTPPPGMDFGAVVGADPWGDEDAATYTESVSGKTAAFPTGWEGGPYGDIDALTLPPLTAATASVTLRTYNAGGANTALSNNSARLELWSPTFSAFFGRFHYPAVDSPDVVLPAVDTTYTVEATIDPAQMQAALEGGAVLQVLRSTDLITLDTHPAYWKVRVERLVITVTYSDITPVTRLFPRDDGRGIGNSPRIHPPTKANRIVGGYQ